MKRLSLYRQLSILTLPPQAQSQLDLSSRLGGSRKRGQSRKIVGRKHLDQAYSDDLASPACYVQAVLSGEVA